MAASANHLAAGPRPLPQSRQPRLPPPLSPLPSSQDAMDPARAPPQGLPRSTAPSASARPRYLTARRHGLAMDGPSPAATLVQGKMAAAIHCRRSTFLQSSWDAPLQGPSQPPPPPPFPCCHARPRSAPSVRFALHPFPCPP
ncbi:vegetative cell wall protein gp1-like [Triticum aestivum]|uniref:vegetative cell wall protein gp1-like n=1 Tax=Triticum aestivum TaxID=4565 RepID=UPI001D00C34E|nr:vegetative cell wall protein gp1-like [Triticum aestivum]